MGKDAKDGELSSGTDSEVYLCWMCGAEHKDPAAYLWHIHACGLELKEVSFLPAKELSVLTAKVTG